MNRIRLGGGAALLVVIALGDPSLAVAAQEPIEEVVITARKRVRAHSIAASVIGSPCSRRALANSTIRMAFFAASAIRTTRPIWA